MKFKVLIVFIFLICENSFAEPNNLETEDFFYIGKMQSYNNDFTLYFKTRNKAVPGEGSLKSKIMFVGEAPGAREDEQGLPFVGAAGNVLSEMLHLVGLNREQVYIANIVKCRPPNNRDPSADEIGQCWKYLDEQIDLIDPQLIVTLGRHSFSNFFPGELISQARGRPREWKDRIVFPVYHPAATLHNPKLKPVLQEDFLKIKAIINDTQ